MNDPLYPSHREGSPSWHARWRKKHASPAQESVLTDQTDQQISFDRFLEAIRLHMQPEGRAQHMAGMHQYLRTLLPADVSLADLAAGWQVLAQGHNAANSEVLHRRKTCAELAAIAAPLTREQGHLAGAVKAWQAWFDASQSSADPRLTAMRATFARELVELQSEQ